MKPKTLYALCQLSFGIAAVQARCDYDMHTAHAQSKYSGGQVFPLH
jgi:hypothetical protein